MNHFFRYAGRSLYSRKFFSLVNITGLAVGLAVFVLLMTHIRMESSYDHYHQKADRTYKMITRVTDQRGEVSHYGIVMGSLNDQLIANFPEVEAATLLYGPDISSVDIGESRFNTVSMLYTDYSFFDIFDYKGHTEKAFSRPDQVVISRGFAEKAFAGDAVGELITYGDKTFTVAEVVDIPTNTRFVFEMLLPLEAFPDYVALKGEGLEFESFITLKSEDNNSATVEKLASAYDHYVSSKWPLFSPSNYMLPLKEVYLDSTTYNRLGNGNRTMLMIYLAVAVVILALALINYLNLQVAYSLARKGEMKIRKIMGAGISQILGMSLAESILVISMAAALALMIVGYTGTLKAGIMSDFVSISLPDWGVVEWSALICVLLLLIVFSAAFSSRQLSGLSRISSEPKLGKGAVVLIVFQFFITSCLLSSILFINDQMNYLQTFDKGFNQDNVVIIRNLSDAYKTNYKAIKERLLSFPSVMAVSGMQSEPGTGTSGQEIKRAEAPDDQWMDINHIRVLDGGYLETFGLQLVAGEGFSEAVGDEYQFVINEAAAKRIFPGMENPVGELVNMSGRNGQIVGVVKDYNYQSLRTSIEPLVIDIEDLYYLRLAIKINGENTKETLDQIEALLQETDQRYVMDYSFMDQQFERVYRAELKGRQVLGFATMIAFGISLFGLLSITVFVIRSRSKEVAMRKILGAGYANLLWNLSRQSLIAVTLGNLIAVPVVYWFVKSWTSNFVYHISATELLWIMPIALLISVVVAFLAVLHQIWRAVTMNPVDYLRYE